MAEPVLAAGVETHQAAGPRRLSPSRRYLSLLRADYADFKIVIVFAIVGAILYLAVPITVDAFLSNVQFGTIVQPLLVLATALLACLVLLAILQGMQVYAVEVIQRRIFVRVAGDFAWRLPRVRREAFDALHAPELVNRFLETVIVQKKTASILSYAINSFLTTLVGLVLLGVFHPALLTFSLLLLGALALIVFAMSRGGVRTAVAESKSKYEVVDWLEELVRHETVFATQGGAQVASRIAQEQSSRYLGNRIRHFRILFRQIVGGLVLQTVAATVVLAVGGWLVLNQQLTVGQLVASELIVSTLVANISKLGQILEAWYDVCAAADKLGNVFDLPLESAGGEQLSLERADLSLRVHDVDYGYGGPQLVLERFHMRAPQGARVALVGGSGAGITTLLDILYGLREPPRGAVTFAGLDLRALDLASVRERVALVRHSEIIDGTVLENLQLTNPGLGLERAREVLEGVGLWNTILELPGGLACELASGGKSLASGQALRLTLARAFARQPRVVLLDDVLDRLEPAERGQVMDVLFDPKRDWTVIVSTQLEEVLERCDRLVRVPEGEEPGFEAPSAALEIT